ncbi:uncharacterized protein LOC134536638 [Bacillus rossius redtenbacheri]|uniref:uncharacterized protein LOC134536638 n=1 Tax=Bacillus rossius redtenbacheri TaxID=93214 RepID=UPI002FDE39AC
MESEIFNLNEGVSFDDSITKSEVHSYSPYISGPYLQSSEVIITIQNEDVYTLPSQSFIRIRGVLLKNNGQHPTTTWIIRNGVLHLFSRISYNLNGIELDSVRDPGITCTIKNYLNLTRNELPVAKMAGWGNEENFKVSVYEGGKFEICVPLATILGFADDYKHIIINSKQELVFSLANTWNNSVLASEENPENMILSLLTIKWMVPHIEVKTQERLRLLKFIEKGKDIELSFRSWTLESYPSLPRSHSINWNVKFTLGSERFQFIILGFQKERQNTITADKSIFDQVNIKNVKVFLNSQAVPVIHSCFGLLNLTKVNHDGRPRDLRLNSIALLYSKVRKRKYADWENYRTKVVNLLRIYINKKFNKRLGNCNIKYTLILGQP